MNSRLDRIVLFLTAVATQKEGSSIVHCNYVTLHAICCQRLLPSANVSCVLFFISDFITAYSGRLLCVWYVTVVYNNDQDFIFFVHFIETILQQNRKKTRKSLVLTTIFLNKIGPDPSS